MAVKAEYQWVDISKFIFALCVVAIHANLFGQYKIDGWISPLMLRVAVPYFFVASGFFIGIKCYKQESYNGFSKWGGYLSA